MASMGQRRPAAAPAAAPRPSGAGCGQGEPQGFFGREQSDRRQKKGAPAPGSQRGTTSPRPLAKRRGTLVGSEQSERGAAFSGRRTSARRGTKFPAAPERGSPAHSVGEGAGASEARSEAKRRQGSVSGEAFSLTRTGKSRQRPSEASQSGDALTRSEAKAFRPPLSGSPQPSPTRLRCRSRFRGRFLQYHATTTPFVINQKRSCYHVTKSCNFKLRKGCQTHRERKASSGRGVDFQMGIFVSAKHCADRK